MAATGVEIFVPTLVNASGVPVSGGNVTFWKPTTAGAPSATPRSVYTDPELTNPTTSTTLGTSGHKVLYRDPDLGVVMVIKSADNATTYATVFLRSEGDARDSTIVDVDEYGADPTGASDSTSAIQDAATALEAIGGGTLWFKPGGTYKIYPDTSNTSSLGDFDNCKGIDLAFNGCTFTVARAFTGTQTLFPWVFEGCVGINWGDCTVTCSQADTPANAYTRGICWMTILNTNSQVSGGFVKQTGGKSCIDIARDSSTQTNRTKGVRIKRIEAVNVGYSLQLRNSGDDVDVGYVHATDVTRPIIAYGFHTLSAVVERVSTGASGETQMLFMTNGTGSELTLNDTVSEGLELWYRSNTAPTNGCHIAIEMRGTSAMTLRDFDIHLDIDMDSGGGLSQQALAFYKTTASVTTDTTPSRGHVIEDFKLRGNVRNVPATAVFDFFTTSLGEWSGETVRNWSIDGLYVTGSASSSLRGDLAPFVDGPHIRNFVFPGTQKWDDIADNSGVANPNLLCNGHMAISQRGSSFTSTSSANNDDSYILDRWNLVSDGNDIVDVSRDLTTVPTGARFSMLLDVETANKQFGIVQVLEAADCTGIMGKKATLSFKARKGNSNATAETLRFAILSWSSTANAVTSDVVGTWAGNGTNPTLAANWTYENTPQSVTLTTTWSTYAVTALLDTASLTNVAVFIWCDDVDATVGDFIYITDVKLEPGVDWTPAIPAPLADEQRRARRYYQSLTVYVPGTTAQNLRAIDMITIPTIAGGGAGFDSTGTTADTLIAFQTTGAATALTLNSEL